MSELEVYVTENYGTCDRGSSACYHGMDGCLRTGWIGTMCDHWHPVEGKDMDNLIQHLSLSENTETEGFNPSH